MIIFAHPNELLDEDFKGCTEAFPRHPTQASIQHQGKMYYTPWNSAIQATKPDVVQILGQQIPGAWLAEEEH